MSHPQSLRIGVLAIASLICGCVQGPKAPSGKQLRSNITTVEKWLTGTFDSTVTGDRIIQARIWEYLDDGPWFYSQHPAQSEGGHPTQARIVRLQVDATGDVAMHVYGIPGNALDFPAPWTGNGSMGGLHPDSLEHLEGCTIVLQRIDGNEFSGATVGDGCASRHPGAVYETSQISLRSNRMTLLSRGYDSSGKQVWGSTGGPVIYRHTSRNPPEE